jgi:predicted secreted Zn-dependent protease
LSPAVTQSELLRLAFETDAMLPKIASVALAISPRKMMVWSDFIVGVRNWQQIHGHFGA